ncbi:MAG TPA: phosphoribosyltransferase family protein [Chloroflexia bacterium]|nr:phosphoribosyltransferase family protein [Chloroflexia bacterium]
MNHDKPQARFRDRTHAGYELAVDLRGFLQGEKALVLAVPANGVPVAAAVAGELDSPFDVIVSRRIMAAGEPEETLGAVTPDRTLVVNTAAVRRLGLSDQEVEQLSIPVWAEARRMTQRYRSGRPYPELHGRTIVIVDDGVTTGYTVMAAAISVRNLEPARVVAAVPVASIEAIERLGPFVDDVLSLEIRTESPFSVADHYVHYEPTSDQEVVWMLERGWAERPPHGYSETF